MTTWEANLAAMREFQPALAEALSHAKSLLPAAETAPDGGMTVRLAGDSGAWVHSRRAPRREIDRLVDEVQPGPLQPIILLGVGLGDALERLLRAHDRTDVCVLEHNLGLIRAAMERFNFTKAIDAKRLTFACTVTGQTPRMVFQAALTSMSLFGRTTVSHGYTASDPGYLELMRELKVWAGQKELEIRSEANGAKTNLENLFGNFPVYLRSAGLDQFAGTFKGVPGVLVCAGPSLQRNIEVLKQYSGKVVVLAVSSALRRVMQSGIEVHATNVVDYSHLSQRYFKDLPGDAPPLFAHPRCNMTVLDGYSGEVVTSDDELYQAFEIPGVVPHGGFRYGGNNVAHFGHQILRALGCNPVVYCGLDLAYSFHTTHVPGGAIHDEWAASSGRFSSLEFQELMFLTAGLSDKHAVKDPYGTTIYTDELLESAGLHFEEFLSTERVEYPETVTINCTEGGRVIAGIENRSLASVMAEYAVPGGVDTTAFNRVLERAHTGVDARLKAGREVLRKLERDLVDIAPMIEEVRTIIDKALERMKGGEVSEFHHPSFDKLGDWLERRRGLISLMYVINSGDRISRRILEAKLADERIEEKERIRLLAEREAQWVKALAENRQSLIAMIQRHAKRMDTILAASQRKPMEVGVGV